MCVRCLIYPARKAQVPYYGDIICDTIRCDLIWFDLKWFEVMWFAVIWSDVMWCHLMWCDVMRCHFMRCDAMRCDVMWCVCYLKLGWQPVAVVQYTVTNKQYIKKTQLTTLVGRLSGIRTQSGQTKINDELTAQKLSPNWEECGPCSVIASYTQAFALQLREKHGKPSLR